MYNAKLQPLPLLPVLIMSRAAARLSPSSSSGSSSRFRCFKCLEKAVEGESLRVLGVFRKVRARPNLRSFEKELEESCKSPIARPAYRQLRWMFDAGSGRQGRGRRGWLGLLRTEHPLPGRRLLSRTSSPRTLETIRPRPSWTSPPNSPSRHRPAGRARAVKTVHRAERLRRGLAPTSTCQ